MVTRMGFKTVAPLTSMANRRKHALVGCFAMGILNREVGEVELIPVAKGILSRWWIVLIAALLGTVAMWSQESDLSSTPAQTEVVRIYESRDETALLSLVGIDPAIVSRYALEIKSIVDLGVEVAIVIGGGNIYRGMNESETGIERAHGDYMGMLATMINAMALQAGLESVGVHTRLQSAIEMKEISEAEMVEAIKFAHEAIKLQIEAQEKMRAALNLEYRSDDVITS